MKRLLLVLPIAILLTACAFRVDLYVHDGVSSPLPTPTPYHTPVASTATPTLEPEFPTPYPTSTPVAFAAYRWEAEDFTSAENTGVNRNPDPPYRTGTNATMQPNALSSNGWHLAFIDNAETWTWWGAPFDALVNEVTIRVRVSRGIEGRVGYLRAYLVCLGNDVELGDIFFDDVQGWQSFYTVSKTFPLASPTSCLDGVKLVAIGGDAFNLDWVELQPGQ